MNRIWRQYSKEVKETRLLLAKESGQFEKDLAIAIGCIYEESCDDTIILKGSCPECIINAAFAVEKLKSKGYKF